MADTFNYSNKISKSFTRTSKPSVVSASFGNGYSQRISQGINTQTDSWELSFTNQPTTVANEILSFFESKKGVDSFWFLPPYDANIPYLVICSEWSYEHTSHISKSITATFTRVYDII